MSAAYEGAEESLLAPLRKALPPGPFLGRRLGRAAALQALYEADLAHHPVHQVLERIDARLRAERDYSTDEIEEAVAYATELVDGVLANREEIDRTIHERAPAWPLAQISAVDRNVLRIGLYESLFGNAKVPFKAAINEAVELAKLFGSETSAKFVNGVLGRAVEIGRNAEPAQPQPPHRSETRAPEPTPDETPVPPAGDARSPDEQHDPILPKGGETMAASSEERLKKIIADQLSVSEDEVVPEANFIEDLNADSLDLVELIMSLEEEFNVKISDEDAEKIRTVQDAMDYLHEHSGA